MKKEIKHDCPDRLVYSNKAGHCINPKLDQNENDEVDHNCPDGQHFDAERDDCRWPDESLNEYSKDPEDRQKIPTKSLRFRHTAGKGVNGVSNESDD